MKFRQIKQDKKAYLPLLLLGDEQEDMIDRYLEDGRLFILEDNGVKTAAVVSDNAKGVCELKNLATVPAYQRMGYGSAMLRYLFAVYEQECTVMWVGTGESPLTVPFYERCGFRYSHRVRDFFTKHYEHPIIEAGVMLKDMIYLRRELKKEKPFVLETERLWLREMTQEDYGDLCGMLQDAEVMYAYEHAFTDEEAHDWLDRQRDRYRRHGFGLWAMIEKQSSAMIGQAGITIQDIEDSQVPEIGYLLNKQYWHKGYASEAASACKRYAFDCLGYDKIYSIIRDNNIASRRVAKRNGMHCIKTFVKHYYGIDMPHMVFCAEK